MYQSFLLPPSLAAEISVFFSFFLSAGAQDGKGWHRGKSRREGQENMFEEKGMVINGGNFEKRMMRLGVRACKSEDEGMNLVFMTYADVCALAGSEVQQDSLCVILEVTLLVARPMTSHSSCCPCIPLL